MAQKRWNGGLLKWLAQTCAVANRQQCRRIGEEPSPTWRNMSRDQREGLIQGVKMVLDGALPRELHESWMGWRKTYGWTYGPRLNRKKKRHPDMVPWKRLPISSQYKTFVFMEVIAECMRVYSGYPKWVASKSAYARTKKRGG